MAPRLTASQEEWLLLFGDGLTAREAGAARGVSEDAARQSAARLRRKFGVARTRELVPAARAYFLLGRLDGR